MSEDKSRLAEELLQGDQKYAAIGLLGSGSYGEVIAARNRQAASHSVLINLETYLPIKHAIWEAVKIALCHILRILKYRQVLREGDVRLLDHSLGK